MLSLRTRLQAGLIGIGIALALDGLHDVRLAQGASSTPVTGDLAALESGAPPPDGHLQLGQHVGLFPQSIYSYEKTKENIGNVPPTTAVNYVFYPIISMNHPFVAEIQNIEKQMPKNGTPPPDFKWPQPKSFRVLVKTFRFQQVKDLPGYYEVARDIKGLLINNVSGLNADEEKLVRESFPGIDLSHVLILQQNLTPPSTINAYWFLGAGSLMILFGLWGLTRKWRAKLGGEIDPTKSSTPRPPFEPSTIPMSPDSRSIERFAYGPRTAKIIPALVIAAAFIGGGIFLVTSGIGRDWTLDGILVEYIALGIIGFGVLAVLILPITLVISKVFPRSINIMNEGIQFPLGAYRRKMISVRWSEITDVRINEVVLAGTRIADLCITTLSRRFNITRNSLPNDEQFSRLVEIVKQRANR